MLTSRRRRTLRHKCFPVGLAFAVALAGPSAAGAAGGAEPAKPAKPAKPEGPASPGQAPPVAKLGQRTLRAGMRGPDVRELQRHLNELGFRTPADGSFGARTTRGVRAFERAAKRPADGVVLPEEARLIVSVVAANGSGGATAPTPAPPQSAPASPAAPSPPAPGAQAKLGPDGLAIAPSEAPAVVQAIIAAGNEIAKTPYRYGGGHANGFKDTAYDCSGSVSYALNGAKLLDSPLASGDFMNWAEAGPGQWVTIYAHGGHMYMVVAGLRFDTSGAKQTGSRWQAAQRPTSGYSVRHPAGL